jgi:hypothetical protein
VIPQNGIWQWGNSIAKYKASHRTSLLCTITQNIFVSPRNVSNRKASTLPDPKPVVNPQSRAPRLLASIRNLGKHPHWLTAPALLLRYAPSEPPRFNTCAGVLPKTCDSDERQIHPAAPNDGRIGTQRRYRVLCTVITSRCWRKGWSSIC